MKNLAKRINERTKYTAIVQDGEVRVTFNHELVAIIFDNGEIEPFGHCDDLLIFING